MHSKATEISESVLYMLVGRLVYTTDKNEGVI